MGLLLFDQKGQEFVVIRRLGTCPHIAVQLDAFLFDRHGGPVHIDLPWDHTGFGHLLAKPLEQVSGSPSATLPAPALPADRAAMPRVFSPPPPRNENRTQRRIFVFPDCCV
jgi:hypothetical protein